MPRPRLLLVHGSVVNGQATWGAQRPLEERFELVIPNRRGFPPGPDVERVDFEDEAVWLEQYLEPGTHLVGHSYGGVISLLAAARRPDAIRSLTVNEPPAFGVARGDPAVEEFLRQFEVAPGDPRGYLEFFLPLVGSDLTLPDPLPPALDAGARAALVERPPHEAEIALDDVAAAPFPKLVVSGGHSGAFDAVCDVLERRLAARRAVVPGAGHSIPRAPGYNDVLVGFLDRP